MNITNSSVQLQIGSIVQTFAYSNLNQGSSMPIWPQSCQCIALCFSSNFHITCLKINVSKEALVGSYCPSSKALRFIALISAAPQ